MPAERLQKIIAQVGLASRRKAEELITSGRVSVNGHKITELGAKADVENDDIRVDGKPLRAREGNTYILLNKPKGYVTTVSDPEGRPTVLDLLRGVRERLYPVGRLDFNSEGLLLLTNDGELAHLLGHASSSVPKVYLVKVAGQPAEEDLQRLRDGVTIALESAAGARRVRTAPAEIKLYRAGENPWYEVTLIEGRNRQIRKMFEEIGHHVEKIKRVQYGPLQLDVQPGEFRPLSPQEVQQLRRAAAGQDVRVGPLKRPPVGRATETLGDRRAQRKAREKRAGFGAERPYREGGDGPQRRFGGDEAAERGFERRPRRDERAPEEPRGSGILQFNERGERTEREARPRRAPARGAQERRPAERSERRPSRGAERGAERRPSRGTERSGERRPGAEKRTWSDRPRPDRSGADRGVVRGGERERPRRPAERSPRPFRGGARDERPQRGGERGARPFRGREERPFGGGRERPPRREERGERPFRSREGRPSGGGERGRPPRREERGERPFRTTGRSERPGGGGRTAGRSAGSGGRGERPRGERSRGPADRPRAGRSQAGGERPRFQRDDRAGSERERPDRGGPARPRGGPARPRGGPARPRDGSARPRGGPARPRGGTRPRDEDRG